MENKEKIITGIVGLILIVSGFGGSQLLTEDQLENAYYCPITQEVGVFDRLSSSMKTGYYIDVELVEQSTACRIGRTYEAWVPLKEYAKSQGIDPLSLIVADEGFPQATGIARGGTQYECNSKECVRIQ